MSVEPCRDFFNLLNCRSYSRCSLQNWAWDNGKNGAWSNNKAQRTNSLSVVCSSLKAVRSNFCRISTVCYSYSAFWANWVVSGEPAYLHCLSSFLSLCSVSSRLVLRLAQVPSASAKAAEEGKEKEKEKEKASASRMLSLSPPPSSLAWLSTTLIYLSLLSLIVPLFIDTQYSQLQYVTSKTVTSTLLVCSYESLFHFRCTPGAWRNAHLALRLKQSLKKTREKNSASPDLLSIS